MKSRLSVQEKRALWVLTAVVLISRSAFALLNDHLIFGTVFVDDAFYALSVARHIALGHGFTADGIHPTNGFQPLNTLLQSVCFFIAGGDRFNGVRWCFVLSALIEVAFIWAIAILISKMHRTQEPQGWWHSAAVIAATMQTFVFTLFAMHSNGLETALASLMIVLVISNYDEIRTKREKGNAPTAANFLWLGFLCGFLVLARLDGAVLVLIFAVLELRFPNGFRNAVIIGGVGFLISSPWWLYGLFQFGSLMPISGQSESFLPWSTQALLDAANALQDIFLFWIPRWHFVFPQWVSLPVATVTVGLMAMILRRIGFLKTMRASYDLRPLTPLLIFGMFLFIYYTFLFRAPWFLDRYWHPIEMRWMFLMAIAVSMLIPKIQSLIEHGHTGMLTIGSLFILIVIAVNLRMDRRPYVPQVPADLAEIGFWAQKHPNVSVGVLQSGAAGFLADNVINLDGKVNLDALHARQQDSLGAYILRMNFEYLADEQGFLDPTLQKAARLGCYYDQVDSIRSVRIFRRSNIADSFFRSP